MNILHFEKDFQYTDQDLLMVARKIGKLATYCKRIKDESSWIRIEVERRSTKKQRDQLKMMVTVHLPQKMFRAESRKPTVIECADRCMEKLEPQIKKYKELHTGLGRVRVKRKIKQRN